MNESEAVFWLEVDIVPLVKKDDETRCRQSGDRLLHVRL